MHWMCRNSYVKLFVCLCIQVQLMVRTLVHPICVMVTQGHQHIAEERRAAFFAPEQGTIAKFH